MRKIFGTKIWTDEIETKKQKREKRETKFSWAVKTKIYSKPVSLNRFTFESVSERDQMKDEEKKKDAGEVNGTMAAVFLEFSRERERES